MLLTHESEVLKVLALPGQHDQWVRALLVPIPALCQHPPPTMVQRVHPHQVTQALTIPVTQQAQGCYVDLPS